MVQPANLGMFVGILFGLVPAMALLYYMLSRYEGFFEDRRVFKWLLIGIGVGSVVTTFEIVVLGFQDAVYLRSQPVQVGLVLLAVGYAGLESVVKTSVLNWHSVRALKDLPFYAVPLGLGFGAANAFILVARGVVAFTSGEILQTVTHFQMFLFFGTQAILFIGGIMIHAFTAAVISAALSEGMPFRGLFGATVLGAPFYVGYYAFYSLEWGTFMAFALPVAVLLYGLWAIRYTITKILDNVVPPEIARQVRRDIRKKRQGA
ncbi:MAG: hypothetical protein KY455_06900 [Euryarchaeota archaeon]|nr:hypothetical protein [Euryarchaeota archaeon]